MAGPEVGKDSRIGALSRLLDRSVVRASAFLYRRVESAAGSSTLSELKRMAAEESAIYVREHMMPCGLFEDRYRLMDSALSQIPPSGLVLEFGVRHGRSINYLASKLGSRVIEGFDSFEGLDADWAGTASSKGSFSEGGLLPPVLGNVRLTKGWFDQTLPPFLASHPEAIAFAHLDADTYEATAYVLEQLSDHLTAGTVIQFDEYLGYPGWRYGEYRAFRELVCAHGLSYRYIGTGFLAAAIRVVGVGVGGSGGPVRDPLPEWMDE